VRGDTRLLIDRIADMVILLRAQPWSRAELAGRWKITPRAAHDIIQRADELFGIRVEYGPDGYFLTDEGIATFHRRKRWTR
jgi:hypothetical protein